MGKEKKVGKKQSGWDLPKQVVVKVGTEVFIHAFKSLIDQWIK